MQSWRVDLISLPIATSLFLSQANCAFLPQEPEKLYERTEKSSDQIAVFRTPRGSIKGICEIDGVTFHDPYSAISPKYEFHLEPGVHEVGVGLCTPPLFMSTDFRRVEIEFEAGHLYEFQHSSRFGEDPFRIIDLTTGEVIVDFGPAPKTTLF